MPILSSSLALTRYRIMDEVPDALLRDAPNLLKKFAFQDIDASAEERSFGWVCLDDWLDEKWRTAPPEKAHYLTFSLRLDTRRISPAVLKKHLTLALRAEAEIAKEKGKNFLSRDRKQEIKDQVKLRLLARSLPIPAVFDVVWNLRSHRVLLASANAKVKSLFEDSFTATFGLRLEPLSPFFLAISMLGEESVARLENLEPTVFV